MRVVDLSCELFDGMQVYYGDPPFQLTFVRQGKAVGDVTLSRVSAGSHSGTHVDAPLHFIPGGRSVDEIGPEHLVVRALMADVSRGPLGSPIEPEELREAIGGRRPEGLVINTGIWAHRGEDLYMYAWRFLSRRSADYLSGLGLKVVATDAMSVGGWPGAPGAPWPPTCSADDVSYVHVRLLSSGIVVVEGLCNLDQLRGCDEFTLVVAPLKVRGAEASMARVLAIC